MSMRSPRILISRQNHRRRRLLRCCRHRFHRQRCGRGHGYGLRRRQRAWRSRARTQCGRLVVGAGDPRDAAAERLRRRRQSRQSRAGESGRERCCGPSHRCKTRFAGAGLELLVHGSDRVKLRCRQRARGTLRWYACAAAIARIRAPCAQCWAVAAAITTMCSQPGHAGVVCRHSHAKLRFRAAGASKYSEALLNHTVFLTCCARARQCKPDAA